MDLTGVNGSYRYDRVLEERICQSCVSYRCHKGVNGSHR